MSILSRASVVFDAIGVDDVHRGNAEVERSTQQATRTLASNFEQQKSSTLRVVLAQRQYADAVRRSGAESNQAVRSLIRLKDAEARVASETNRTSESARRAGSGFRTFAHDVERAGFGVAVGSKAIHGLRTALVFSASGLAGFGLTSVIRASRDAAIEQQVALGQLQAALKAAGLGQAEYARQAREAIDANQNLGFSEDTAVRSFTLAVRATKSVEGAQRLQAIAADVARGRNMDLVAATQLLVRVQAGQVGSLRRLGIEVAKGISGAKALDAVQRQYAGAAATYADSAAGAQDRFNIAIHRTEETIGTALLPVITNLNTRLANWLNNSKNQERIQKDVNQAIRVGGAVAHQFGEAVHYVSVVLGPLNRLLGGTDNTIRTLGTVLAAIKLRSLAADMQLFGLRTKQAGANAVVATGEFNALTGAEARAAAGGVAGGAGASTFLRNVAPYIGGAAALGAARGPALPTGIGGLPLAFFGSQPDLIKTPQVYIDGKHIGALIGPPPKPGSVKTINGTQYVAVYRNGTLFYIRPSRLPSTTTVNTKVSANPGSGQHRDGTTTATTTRRPLSLAGQYNIAALRLAQAGLTPDTGDDVRYLNQEASILRKEIAASKNLADKTSLIGQLSGVLGQLQQIQDAKDQAAADKLQSSKEKRVKAREAALKRKKARDKALNDRIKQLYKEDIAGSTSNANQALKDRSEYLNKKYGLGLSTTSAITKTAKKFPGPNAALARELQDAVAGLAQYAPNINVHQYFPHPPTDDGNREAIYTRHALQAAFD